MSFWKYERDEHFTGFGSHFWSHTNINTLLCVLTYFVSTRTDLTLGPRVQTKRHGNNGK